MGNRVEDLERQVAELRAAVDGLTEELVETKERLNQLEASGDAETDDEDRRERAHVEFVPNQSPEEHTEYVGQRDQEPNANADPSADADEQSTTGETRQDTAQAEARGGTRDQTATDDHEETADDEDSDDIIVA